LLGRTHYAGAFLFLDPVLDWLSTAQDCFRDDCGTLTRGLLTSAFAPIIGLERIYHLDEMEDLGFALLTGGRRCPSRFSVGGWRCHLPWWEVDRFCQRTSPWELVREELSLSSYDEHSIPRWTRKHHIPKGYVTTRNKHMRCEKLYYTYEVLQDRYLAVRATPGNVGLHEVAVPLVQQTLRYGQPTNLHALFDAGGGKSDAAVRALWDLAATERARLDVTLRACRYPHRVKLWKGLPREDFTCHEEPGPYVAAPPKELRLAETLTTLKGESAEQGIRTLLAREVVRGPKKDRWHALYTTSRGEPEEVLNHYRLRQHHEQGYRVGVHDASLNAVRCGYDKDSPDPKRPRWHRGPLQMMGWLVALVYNAVADLTTQLVGDWRGSHISTIRRCFINRPGALYQTPNTLIVQLDKFGGQEALVPALDEFNAAGHRLPWLNNRQVIMSLTPTQPRAGPS
jgi:hypothetical protein